MTGSRWNFTLPLLTRELIAQAARRRTYALRVLLGLFAGWLGLTFYEAIQRQFRFGGDPLSIFGRGDEIYDSLIWIQFGVIYLLLPLQSAGLLTEEKERDTLQLLLITRLGPWKILIEKLLSRLVPMSTLLLVCLPLQAFAYGLGGVPPGRLVLSTSLLGLAMLQMGSLGLMASSFHRTTGRATASVLGLVCATLFGPGLVALLVILLAELTGGSALNNWLERVFTSAMARVGLSPPQALFPFFGGLHYQLGTQVGLMSQAGSVVSGLLVLFQSLAMLGLARFWLWRRAALGGEPSVTRRRRLRAGPARSTQASSPETSTTDPATPATVRGPGEGPLDQQVLEVSRRTPTKPLASPIELPEFQAEPADEELPNRQPVAWREVRRQRQRWPAWVFAVLPLVLIPLTLLAFQSLTAGRAVQAMLFTAYWLTGLLRFVVVSTGLFCGERSRQSLDVLRTLPLTGTELTREKLRGLRPVGTVYAVAFTLNSLCHAALMLAAPDDGWQNMRPNDPAWVALYLMNALLVPALDLTLIGYLGCLVSLRIKSHQRAIWVMLGLILTWILAPYCTVGLVLDSYSSRDSALYKLINLLSPTSFPVMNEVQELHRLIPWGESSEFSDLARIEATFELSIGYLLGHAALLLVIRWVLQRVANRVLGGATSDIAHDLPADSPQSSGE